MRILDVGCGKGNPPRNAKIGAPETVIGIDVDLESLALAKEGYPQRHFLCGRAESLPFSDHSFDRVVSAVAIPYTNIPLALMEVRRVLIPGGSLFMSVHNLRFTLKELCNSVPRPIPTLFRLYVIANGLIFHASGKMFRFANGRIESFQTIRGLKLALERTGFVDIMVSRPDGKFVFEAKTIPSDDSTVALAS